MCSVTFIPRADGFLLGMNRDESRQRPAALAPRIFQYGARTALHPSEPSGGTWIGVNDSGLCCALLNWYSIPSEPARVNTSRGFVVPALLAAGTMDEAGATLTGLDLEGMAPFRLVVVLPDERAVREYRWNQETLAELRLPWELQHWFSSGFDERSAQQQRFSTARRAAEESDAGALPWLRRLHTSHAPAVGPFSICMHRPDAATVSYTEIASSSEAAEMRYHDGPLCTAPHPGTTHKISLHAGCKESQLIPTNQQPRDHHENQQSSL